jgi:Tfp pilus assembly protein PilN
VRRPANLASRPFRNERLPGLLFGLALVALAGLTLEHARLVGGLLPGNTSARHTELAGLETEVAQLRSDGLALRGPGPDRSSVARWLLLKEIVDRRSFAWTALLARLEATMPPGIRLAALSPGWEKGQVRLGLRALARTSDDGFELVKALEDQPDFDEVYPVSKHVDAAEDGEYRFELTMLYRPALRPAADPKAGEGQAAGTALSEQEQQQ